MTTGFNFQDYIQRPHTTARAGEVWLTQTRLNIGRAVYAELGSPPRIRLSFDPRHQAIKLVPAETGLKAVDRSGRGAVMLALRPEITRALSRGTYLPIGGGIFIHESKQR